jgi:UDP-glucose 4-epimerase
MRLIVTGVAGFVGSNLAAALLKNGHSIVGIDNLSYGDTSNIRSFISNPNFQFIEHNVCDPFLFEKVKGDVLIHLASQKIPRYTNAFRTLNENSMMLKNVIDKCNKDKIKLVFASTSDVYGKNPNLPYAETSDLVMGPTTVKRWAYALSKIYAEQLIIANSAEFGLEFTIMRFFGSYGPNQNTSWWGGPQAVFIQNIMENKPMEIHGNGQQTRTFTYIEDTVQGIIKCIFETNAKNEIFNIAAEPDEEISILELANKIWQLMKPGNPKPDIKYIPYETFGQYEDVKKRIPSIKKIKEQLDYNPRFSLTEGLAYTIQWQKNKHESLQTNLI